jgi:hypothetical protein
MRVSDVSVFTAAGSPPGSMNSARISYGFRRTGCILSKRVKGPLGQSGAALTRMSSAPASDPCAPALGAGGVDREADANRGIGRAVPHEYQGENSGLSDRPWDGAAFASPLLGG